MTFLTTQEIINRVPSVLTNKAHDRTGSQYSNISTYEVLNALFDLGFEVTFAKETKSREVSRKGFSKHMLRLRRREEQAINGLYPEIVLINSHDGSSSYQMRAGMYRLICSNGLTVGNDHYLEKVRHQGNVIEKVSEACEKIITVYPEIIETANEWSGIELSKEQSEIYASSASLLKWGNDEINKPVNDIQLLQVRRYEDDKNDLWTTFNRVQENLIRGGIYVKNEQTKKTRRSREISSPAENNRLNTALWTLTEKMASLAK